MKRLLPLFYLISCIAFSQEYFNNRYYVKKFIDFEKDGKFNYESAFDGKRKLNVKFLSKEITQPYSKLNPENKKKIDARLALIRNWFATEMKFTDKDGNEFLVTRAEAYTPGIEDNLAMKVVVPANTFMGISNPNKTFKAWVLFEKDKLYVNLWPFKSRKVEDRSNSNVDTSTEVKDTTTNRVKGFEYEKSDMFKTENLPKNEEGNSVSRDDNIPLFYQLDDDQMIVLKFQENYFTAVTIPLKYRFDGTYETKDDNGESETKDFDETFTSGVNISFFGGHTWGRTKFTHRKKVGNRTITYKNSLGAFLGYAVEEINAKNTDESDGAPINEESRKIGLLSGGLGFVKSWNKIAIGAFVGLDIGVGDDANSWVYNAKPWIGLGLGYDLFKL